MSGSPIPKKALILILALPIAALLGYMLAGPLDYTTIFVYGSVLGLLLLPIFIQHHHALLVLSLNAAIDIFFLPGKPHLWMLLVLVSLGVTLVSRILDKEMRLILVPSVTWGLVAIMLTVAATAKLTGGLGMKALGDSNYGGKRYVFIAFALLVFLAVSVHRVPLEKARLYVGLYFLSTITAIVSNLAYMVPSMWWLYWFFPIEYALGQAYEDYAVGMIGMKVSRLVGFAPAAQAAVCFLLAQSGIRGLLDLKKPWRLMILMATIGLSMMSGFRSGLILIGLILAIQFCLEGLIRTRLFAAVVLSGVLGLVALVPLVQHLPLSIQRSLSMLPLLEVDAAVRADAKSSTDWRLQMWEVLIPQIPKYFWMGKGYSTSEADYYLAAESMKRGYMRDYELSLLAGDYHNGPLSIILPFGIWGVLGFLAFLVVSIRVLYLNYRFGHSSLKSINTLLFTYFLARVVYFFFIFGQVHTDLGALAGLIGLSVCLNGGVASTSPARAPTSPTSQRVAPASPRTPGRWKPARA